MNTRIVLATAASSLLFLAALFPAQQTPAQKKDTALRPPKNLKTKLAPGYTIPIVDISGEKERQVIVDREAGQYLGHPTTVLLEDGKTMLIVYPKGHGRGAIVYKRSTDGGKTWSERLPTPNLGDLAGSADAAPRGGCGGQEADHHVQRPLSRSAWPSPKTTARPGAS